MLIIDQSLILTHSLTLTLSPAPTHSLIRSIACYSFICSAIFSFVCLFIYSLIDLFVYSFIDLFVYSFFLQLNTVSFLRFSVPAYQKEIPVYNKTVAFIHGIKTRLRDNSHVVLLTHTPLPYMPSTLRRKVIIKLVIWLIHFDNYCYELLMIPGLNMKILNFVMFVIHVQGPKQ